MQSLMPSFQRYVSVHGSFVQLGSSSIFSVSVLVTVRKRQRRYGTAVRTPVTKIITETDTDERKRNAGNQALGRGLT